MFILLTSVVAANKADEIINSPSINPITPIINTKPVKISLNRLFIISLGSEVDNNIKLRLFIIKTIKMI